MAILRKQNLQTIARGRVFRPRHLGNPGFTLRPWPLDLAKFLSNPEKLATKQPLKRFRGKKAILSVISTRNNTLFTLCDKDQKLLKNGWASGGSVGFKNSRKSATLAAQRAVGYLMESAKKHKVRALDVRLLGHGRAKGAVIKTIEHSPIRVLTLSECSPRVHNGCRGPKKRRI